MPVLLLQYTFTIVEPVELRPLPTLCTGVGLWYFKVMKKKNWLDVLREIPKPTLCFLFFMLGLLCGSI